MGTPFSKPPPPIQESVVPSEKAWEAYITYAPPPEPTPQKKKSFFTWGKWFRRRTSSPDEKTWHARITYRAVSASPSKNKGKGWFSWLRRKPKAIPSEDFCDAEETSPLLPVSSVSANSPEKRSRSLFARLTSLLNRTPIPEENRELIDEILARNADGDARLRLLKKFVKILPGLCTLEDSEFETLEKWKKLVSDVKASGSRIPHPKRSSLKKLSYAELNKEWDDVCVSVNDLKVEIDEVFLSATYLHWHCRSRNAGLLKKLEKIIGDVVALDCILCDEELGKKFEMLERQFYRQPPSLWLRALNVGYGIFFPRRSRVISDVSRNNENLLNLLDAADAFGKEMQEACYLWPARETPAYNVYDVTETAKVAFPIAEGISDKLNASHIFSNAEIQALQEKASYVLNYWLQQLEEIFLSLQSHNLELKETTQPQDPQGAYDELRRLLKGLNDVYAVLKNDRTAVLACPSWLESQIKDKHYQIV